MKKFYCIVVVIVSCSIFSPCVGNIKPQSTNGFEIKGIARNVKDSSWVYLKVDNKILDSSMVLGEKFLLRGEVNGPTDCLLYLQNFQDYKLFWVENMPMTFDGEMGKFREAKISGSSTQAEEDVLESVILPLRKEEDSLSILLRNETGTDEKLGFKKKLRDLDTQEQGADIIFIKNHPWSLVSVHVLNVYKTTWSKEIVTELFDRLSDKMKSSTEGKQIQKYIEVSVNPKVGDHFVDFELPNVDGKIIKLSEIKGKFILLDFWAALCGPCRAENKELVKTYRAYHPKGFEILGVSGDNDKTNWLTAIKEDGLVWENVSDLKGDMESLPFLIYGINGIPDNFLIDENGKIVGRNLRGDDLRKKLSELLANEQKQ